MPFNTSRKNALLKEYRRGLHEDIREMNFCIDRLNTVNQEIDDMLYAQIAHRKRQRQRRF